MPQHPAEPHLFGIFEIVEDGARPLSRVVRAASLAEARDYYIRSGISIERLTPSQAHCAGIEGFEIENARPDYAAFDIAGAEPPGHALFASGLPSDMPEPDRVASTGDAGEG